MNPVIKDMQTAWQADDLKNWKRERENSLGFGVLFSVMFLLFAVPISGVLAGLVSFFATDYTFWGVFKFFVATITCLTGVVFSVPASWEWIFYRPKYFPNDNGWLNRALSGAQLDKTQLLFVYWALCNCLLTQKDTPLTDEIGRLYQAEQSATALEPHNFDTLKALIKQNEQDLTHSLQEDIRRCANALKSHKKSKKIKRLDWSEVNAQLEKLDAMDIDDLVHLHSTLCHGMRDLGFKQAI